MAEAGRFVQMLEACQALVQGTQDDARRLDVAALLAAYGFHGHAQAICETVQLSASSATDWRAAAQLAALWRDGGEHAKARQSYEQLLRQWPDQRALHHSLLTSCEYDPAISDQARLAKAKTWGQWAVARAGGMRARPRLQALGQRPLRIGYVSADLCQHTVGFLLRPVLEAHDPRRVSVVAYHSGKTKDWLTEALAKCCTLRDVSALDDLALVEQIRQDQIDVLIDLSGHTGGTRLNALAWRPAPVMVSWLGYFATTGLPCMDAVVLDEWHAPAEVEPQFVESILRLPSGRFCYRPAPWAPETLSPVPSAKNGYVTFGSFNNTAKLNDGLLDIWAQVLLATPDSRLVLKWRTFNDEGMRQKVSQAFLNRGVRAERIECRGPSFHADMLQEYADIDIALDPFPFTGGLTSCEALWMGVPVITWPQSRVVSRQTLAILRQIGLPELVAQDAQDYVRIATELASDAKRLQQMRETLRERMRQSPLMDAQTFTREWETALRSLYADQHAKQSDSERHLSSQEARPMPTIKINDKEYDTEQLTAQAKVQLEMLLATEQEIQRLQTQLAIAQTARNMYAQALAQAVV